MHTIKSGRFTFTIHDMVKATVYACSYFIAHQIAFFFPDSEQIIMTVWPAGGIGLAALLLNPFRLWPVFVFGFYAAGVTADVVLAHRPIIAGMGYMTANMVESVGCALLIVRMSGKEVGFNRIIEVVALLLGTIVVNGFSSCIGAGTATLVKGASFWSAWFSWYVADGLGILLIGPLIVTWAKMGKHFLSGPFLNKIESFVFVLFWCMLAWFSFQPATNQIPFAPHPYMLIALLAWPAFRLGQHIVALSLFLLVVIAIVSIRNVLGVSLLGGTNFPDQLLFMQIFLGFAASTGFLLAAVQSERRRTEAARFESEKQYQDLFDQANEGLMMMTTDGRIVEVNKAFADMHGCTIEEMRNTPIHKYDVLQDETISSRTDIVQRMNNGEVVRFEAKHRRADGTVFQVSITTSLIHTGGKAYFFAFHQDITKRKQSEEALRESEERFRTTFEQAAVGVAHVSTKGYWLRVNQRLCDILGYSRNELLAKSFQSLSLPSDADRDTEAMRRLLAKEIPVFSREKQYIKKDGSLVWAAITVTMQCDANGAPKYFISITEDISLRKRAEKELAERNRFIESIVNMSPDILYIYDLVERKNIYSNDGIQTMLGYTVQEIQGMGDNIIPILMHPDDMRNYLRETIPRYAAAKDNEPVIHQYRMKHKNGKWLWLMAHETVYLRQADGSPRQIFGIIHDITESKRAEDALRESELIFRESQRVANLGSYKLDFSTGFWESSETLDHIFGITSSYNKSVEGWLGLVHPDDRPVVERYFRDEVIGQRKKFDREYRIVRWCDKTVRWVLGQGELTFDNNGSLESMVGIIKDITDLKNAQEQAREHQLQLIQAEKMASIGLLVSGVAHEINNPNNYLMLNSKILQKVWAEVQPIVDAHYRENAGSELAGLPYDEARRLLPDILCGMVDGATRIKRIVDSLRSYSLTDVSNLKQNVDINKAVDTSLVLVSNLIKKSTDFLVVEKGSNLPYVRGSQQQIEQVTINLLTNACQALSQRTQRIEIRTWSSDSEVFLQVKDEGAGIEAAHLSKVMDPFFTTKRDTGGTGLGLPISNNIIKNHSGTIEIASRKGAGTAVLIRVPVWKQNKGTI